MRGSPASPRTASGRNLARSARAGRSVAHVVHPRPREKAWEGKRTNRAASRLHTHDRMAQHRPMKNENEEEQVPSALAGLMGSGEAPQLTIGEPFAIAEDVDLLDVSEAKPGCVAIVRCDTDDCGQPFRINLLTQGVKHCPRCKVGYSHVLLVARADNVEIIGAAMTQVLQSNGYDVPQGDEEDEGEEGDEDEDEEIRDAETGDEG